MSASLDDLERRIRDLDARIAPIAKAPADLEDPDAFEKLREAPHPIDQAGVRPECEALLREIVREYTVESVEWREAVRAFFRKYDSFAWGASLEASGPDEAPLRVELILFSLQDQGKDPRDARLWLEDLCQRAREDGRDLERAMREVAALSSDEDRYDWGSTRRWLEKARSEG